MHKIKFALRILAAVFAVLVISNTAMANEKPEIFVQMGHSERADTMVFSEDGRYLVTGSEDKTVKLWDVDSGREIRTFKGHSSDVTSVAVSSDGRYVVSGDEKGVIKVWDTLSGNELKSFKKYTKQVEFIAFSSDDRHISSIGIGEKGKVLSVWDVFTGRDIKTIRDVEGVFISPASKYILSVKYGYPESTYTLYEITTENIIHSFKSKRYISADYSRDGRYGLILEGGRSIDERIIQIWDIHEGKKLYTILSKEAELYSSITPDGRYGLVAGYSGIKILDINTGRVIKTLTTSSSAHFSPDGKYIISSGPYAPALWDVSTWALIRSFTGRPMESVADVAMSPDGKFVLAGQAAGGIRLWDILTGRLVKIFRSAQGIASVAISPDGKYALSGEMSSLGYKAEMKLWDISTGKEVKTFNLGNSEGAPIRSVSFSPDGKSAIETSTSVLIVDIDTGKIKRKFELGKIYSKSMKIELRIAPSYGQFSPDGRYVVFGGHAYSDDGTRAIIWDIVTDREIKRFEGATSAVFSHDSRYLLYEKKSTIKLWDIQADRVVKAFNGSLLGFSPKGRYIASGSDDGTIKLWEVSTGREIRTLAGHTSWVKSVAFSPDGRYIASGSADDTIRLWDISTGKEIAQFVTFTDGEWIVITPEGYFNASTNGAKHLNVRIGNNVYSIDNFYEKFFNPVYVASVLQGKKIEAVADIRKGFALPPDVKIISPEPNATFNTDIITITVSAKDTGGGIDEIRLYHNGKAIGEDQRAVKIVPKGNEVTKTYTVTLVDGLNNFRAVGFSRDRTESNPYELLVKLTAPSKDVSLYVFAVGINKYKNPALNLNYAEPDARGIVDFFKQKGRGLFKNVALIEIYNEQATKQGIASKLKQLQNTQPQDAVLIYFAGHGESLGDKWYFIPHEITYPEREEDVKTKGISSEELSGLMKNIKAQKILMLIDACKSGAVMIAFRGFEDRKALSQLSRSTGVHIIAASTKDQFAAEVKELGHGVFTYTLLEGLKGKASSGGETVTVRKLMGYVEEQLPDITKKYKQEAQYPVVDSRGMDFPLVIVK